MRNKMEMNHVLVVEDDKEIREGVEIYLKSQGYEVFQAADGVEGLEVIEKEDIHLAIVDIMMPRMDGISMVVKLREKYDFPVIFLSAKSEEVDKIMGLNMGADDYVTKPFSIIELVARIKANIRRATKYINVSHEEEIIQIKDLKIYTDQHKVERGGKIINLTHTEFEILVLLASNPGRAFSKEEMYLKIWNEPYYGNERVLNSHMNRLRGKLNIDNSNKMDYIQTLWGIGYKMEK